MKISVKEYQSLLEKVGYRISVASIRQNIINNSNKILNAYHEKGVYLIEIPDEVYNVINGNITFCPTCVKLQTKLDTIHNLVLQ